MAPIKTGICWDCGREMTLNEWGSCEGCHLERYYQEEMDELESCNRYDARQNKA